MWLFLSLSLDTCVTYLPACAALRAALQLFGDSLMGRWGSCQVLGMVARHCGSRVKVAKTLVRDELLSRADRARLDAEFDFLVQGSGVGAKANPKKKTKGVDSDYLSSDSRTCWCL